MAARSAFLSPGRNVQVIAGGLDFCHNGNALASLPPAKRMRFLSPSTSRRLNEVVGLLCLAAGLFCLLGLVSYHFQDASWDTAAGAARPLNLTGKIGSYCADLLLQMFGAAAFLFPLMTFALGWKWLRSEAIDAPMVKIAGWLMLLLTVCAGSALVPNWRLFEGIVLPGGGIGSVLADWLKASLNVAGTGVVLACALIVSVYVISSFSLDRPPAWMTWPFRVVAGIIARWNRWLKARAERRRQKAQERLARREAERAARQALPPEREEPEPIAPKGRRRRNAAVETEPQLEPTLLDELPAPVVSPLVDEISPMHTGEIPIRPLEDTPPWQNISQPLAAPSPTHHSYRLPPTTLLNDPEPRSPFDEIELKTTAVAIKAKFEEFGVLGSVVQINPGPVVTTFEFKPEAGIKYSRITNLTEDLCLGLQAESILIERIPGKPTVGIEVPNSRRELISLRAVLESSEFQESRSMLTISMGKDINGRIKVAALDSMPHVLIAGSTGSGKSVMINSLVMSILYKATPDEVRMILVDPKRVELGMYEGIPHLLTPVITDARKATIALKNAVLEMERRLRLLAEHGARNIEQFNRKVRKLQDEPRSLFDEDQTATAELRPLPFILILIDELADLMMLEGRNVEESVTRLAQMARAVGMHLVLATQRPSVDVITGLIKANFPARISFRVATRVDSRTILDVMGAEHLLGKGDMLFLPPGSSRLTRVHGAFVTESEIMEVVEFWKEQAVPDYDQSFLIAPPEGDAEAEAEPPPGEQDPMYEDAVRVVLEMGKASTSTLQRRLRLGYGRAARILDMMHRDGIIGPPDGSRPREVLRPPTWLTEVESR
jgi:S-DNA-T family DNA segregation ATPase FtsK/SpoIIIE